MTPLMKAATDTKFMDEVMGLLEKYGAWACLFFVSLFIVWQIISHRRERKKLIEDHNQERIRIVDRHSSERKQWEEDRAKERLGTIETFNKYHEQIVILVNKSTASKNNIASKMVDFSNKIKILHLAIQQHMSLITEGIIKIVPAKLPENGDCTISDFLGDETVLQFKLPKKK